MTATGLVVPLLVAARWIQFAALFVLVGTAITWVGGAAASAFPGAFARSLRAANAAALAAVFSGIAWLIGTIAYATGGFDSLASAEMLHAFFLETPFGGPEAIRLLLMASLLVGFRVPLAPQVRLAAMSLTGAALLVSQAWIGHAAEGGASIMGSAMIFSYALHVLAAACWAGGLPVLAFAAAEARSNGDRAALHGLLRRYAERAAFALGLIIASGTANVVFHEGGSLAALVGSTYGSILLVKVGLFGVMLALAATNRWVLMPRLRQGGTLPALRLSLAADLVVVALVLAAAAVLGITPPPR